MENNIIYVSIIVGFNIIIKLNCLVLYSYNLLNRLLFVMTKLWFWFLNGEAAESLSGVRVLGLIPTLEIVFFFNFLGLVVASVNILLPDGEKWGMECLDSRFLPTLWLKNWKNILACVQSIGNIRSQTSCEKSFF